MMFRVQIIVTLRSSILDPQGTAVLKTLKGMSYSVDDVRVGKFMEMTITADNIEDAELKANEICNKFLVNTVIEDYTLQLQQLEG